MTVEKLQEFIPNLLSKLFIEALIYGNVTKQVRKKKFGTSSYRFKPDNEKVKWKWKREGGGVQ